VDVVALGTSRRIAGHRAASANESISRAPDLLSISRSRRGFLAILGGLFYAEPALRFKIITQAMSDVVEALILDLLEWVAKDERSYEEVMDAWRTSCPRLPVWEDANDRGLVTREQRKGRCVVRVTPSGCALLEQRRPFAGHELPRQLDTSDF
jgi:hypothetical protein